MLGSDGRGKRTRKQNQKRDKKKGEGGYILRKRKEGKGKRGQKKRNQREAVQDHGEYMRERAGSRNGNYVGIERET